MGLTLETSVPVLTVLIQGLLSFFSPCVLPLVPLYVGYLAGGAKTVDDQGNIRYPRGRVLVNTIFFVVGVSFAFFLLGFGFTALGTFFTRNQTWFARISGIIMILFGLYQFGVFGRSRALENEHRLPFRLDRWAMNPLVALVLGFTFSFAWTPCVGPTLGSVLLMASSSGSAARGFLLIGVYTVGFVVPFLAVGLFTGTVLDFFNRHQKVVRYTVKVGAALLVLMGVMTLTGFMNGITSYLSSAAGSGVSNQSQTEESAAPAPSEASVSETPVTEESPAASERPVIPAPDFTLVDQYGETHTLSDYAGKTVFLNFWATWCGPCKSEMPEIQALYEKYGENQGDLIVLGVANPKTEDAPYNQDVTQAEVEQFLEDNGYTFPVVMDTTGEIFYYYGITAFPTTFMIGVDGNVFGYVPGALTGDIMESIVQQTMDGVAEQETK
ncbi:cytochrome c biogenesis protein/redoxin [Flavonifractor sp.]|uniref:cytochrome c biogenesis protein/redoxin n=1 Tax=Flavonifractor sp. TaxID=2049025 RepID=UPI0025BC97F2|nr:cytochrome c biogenesis protein/redoxin [Flavonifractor sp.]